MRKKAFTTAAYFEERKVFWILVFAIVGLIGLYTYFVSASIINVLIREETEINIAALHSRISELETTYVLKKDKVTEELAHNMGFVSVPDKHFVERTLAGKSLTIRE